MASKKLRLALLLLMPWTAGAAAAADWTVHAAVDAPAQLKLNGGVRLRYENIAGQARAGLPRSEDAINLRTNIFAEYRVGAVRVGGELYDSRVYGAQPGTAIGTTEVNALEPLQAYVALDLKAPLGPVSRGSLQAGRFTLDLGSRRIVAADDYRNTLTGFTGVRLDLAGGGNTAMAFISEPQRRLPDDQPSILRNEVKLDRERGDLLFWGAVAARVNAWRGAMIDGGYYGLQEKDSLGRPTRNRRLSVFDVRLVRNPTPGKLDFELEGARQGGTVRAGLAQAAPELPVRAYFLHLRLGRQFTDAWKSRVSAEYDYATGANGGDHYGRFDPLYGMRRGDFAPAGLYSAGTRTNLISPGLRLEVTPSSRVDAFATVRGLWLANARDSFADTGVRDPFGRSGRFAGTQVDARVRYWLVKDVIRLEGDAVGLVKGRFLKNAPNRSNGDAATRYLSLNLSWLF